MSVRRVVPKPPQTQALSSATFRPPPLDGTLSLPEQYDWHLKNTPNHPLFIYARSDQSIRTIKWPEAVRAIHAGARLVRKAMSWTPGNLDVPVAAILAASDTITYFTMSISIMRAGYTLFPISPRNSPAAVAHLINKVNAKCVFVGRDAGPTDLAEQAMKAWDKQNPNVIKPILAPMPLFEELFLESEDDPDDIPYEKPRQEDIQFYVHSSGSTSFPKPIPWTHFRAAQLALCPYFGERDMTGVVWSLHVMPMYHGMGIIQLGWVASTGLVISAFEPKLPAIPPIPKNHFEGAFACNSDIIFCVPAIIEEWSRRPEYVKWLITRGAVLYGGGPLNKTVGDYLTSQGVQLFNLYGSSEGGIMSPILPAKGISDWQYFQFSGNTKAEMVPQGDGTYEFVMVTNPYGDLSVVNTKINGIDSYASSDLFTEHPEKKGYWRIYGRSDDQIMHSTGEKTNPGPLESILSQDPHVQSSVIFGRGRFQAGAIVDVKEGFKFDPMDEAKLAEFRNLIWPTVQRMNEFAPQHSRIFKEMIIVSKPSKPFQYTAKNTPRRQTIINDYEDEINALYDAIADSSQSEISAPRQWDLFNTLEFVRSVVGKVLPQSVDDTADIFQSGCDSLQATWIRNTLLRGLNDTAEIDTRHFVDNFVYDHPTIASLAQFLQELATGATDESTKSVSSRAEAMRAMVEKYNKFTSSRLDKSNGTHGLAGDVVLVTGTTGALGSYLLAELIRNSGVSVVYALNRAGRNGTVTLAERQKRSLLERGLEADAILASEKLVLLETNPSLPRFGLAEDLYEKMNSSVTHILHNAWPVDFNLSLNSFETSIKGLHNLINFALHSPRSSPPTFVYTSSIGILQNMEPSQSSIPETPIAPEVAAGTGYTESKWVSEALLMEASKKRSLNAVIVRVGQLCGGSNGYWNTAEWLPSMVQSGQILGCLPTDDKVVDWIPLHIAAKALVDYRLSGSPSSSTLVHLINPRPTPWSLFAKVIAANMSIELVTFQEWLEKLQKAGKAESGQDNSNVEVMRAIPALRLLPFFRSISPKIASSPNGLGFTRLSCESAVRLSPSLSSSMALQEEDGKSWLRYWESVGFINPQGSAGSS